MSQYRVTQRGPGWDDAWAQALLEPEGLLERPETRMLKRRDAGRTVGLIVLAGRGVVVKLFEEDGPVDAVERLLLGSAAARAARGIGRMKAAGFDAPVLVAVLETPLLRAARRSVLATLAVSDGERADRAWDDLAAAERPLFAASLGAYVRALHQRGVYPQDLWVTNLLASRAEAGWRFVLVDLDRVRVYRRLSWRRRRKNLVQIERSLGRRADEGQRIAFLRSYLGARGAAEIARIGAEIAAAARRRDDARGL